MYIATLFPILVIRTSSTPSCQYWQFNYNQGSESPMNFCLVNVNPAEQVTLSYKYVCNSTGGLFDQYYRNADCSGDIQGSNDVTNGVYKYDCSLPICNDTNPTVSYQQLSNCSTNGKSDNIPYFNQTYIANDCVIFSETDSGIIKCNDNPEMVSFEYYIDNRHCNGTQVEQSILYQGCNKNNVTGYEEFINMGKCTVPVPIKHFTKEMKPKRLNAFIERVRQ